MKKSLFSMLILFVIGLQSILAQSREVSGVVTSADDGLSIPGVSVIIKGTTIGTTTDFDGNFSLKVPADGKVLVFSFVGMTMQEVAITSSTINAVMETESIGMDEVVVTAMGIRKSAKSVTYAVSNVSGDQAAQKSEPDVLRALQGKIPGVSIDGASSVAGSPTRIVIRGASSFKGNNQPLFIVDGIPYSNDQVTGSLQSGSVSQSPLSTLDPNNIQSMNVLKGAAASALYGSRAANGVVIILTKTGNSQGTKKGLNININSSYSVEEVASLPDYQNTYGSGAEFEAANYYGTWGARFDAVDKLTYTDAWAKAYPGVYSAEMDYKAYPDNVKDLFRTGSVVDNSISISGGDQDANIALSLSDMHQKSYIPHSDYTRQSISLGGNTRLDNGLKLGGTFSYTTSERNSPLLGDAGSFQRILYSGRGWDTSLPFEGPNGENLYYKPNDNPEWSWKNNTNKEVLDRMVAGFNAAYDVNSWLSVSYNLGVNTLFKSTKKIMEIGSIRTPEGSIYNKNYKNQEIESLLMLRIKKKINSDLNFRANVGHNANIQKYSSLRGSGEPIIIKGIYQLDNVTDKSAYSYESKKHMSALLGEFTLEYRNYLFLTVTGRNDWSSSLPDQNNSFFYPSISSSFVFTDGLSLDNDVLTSGLIRASWAKVGNDVDAHALDTPYKTNYANNNYVGSVRYTGFPFNGQNMHTLSNTTVDPDLSPEFTEEYEIGTNLEFFGGRAILDVTGYYRSTTDQIASINLPAESGFTSYLTNFGEMVNKGLEIGLDVTPIKNGNFSWNVFASFSRNVSEVKELTDGLTEMNIRNLYSGGIHSYMMVGQSYGVFRGYGPARDNEGNILIDPKSGLMIKSNEQSILGDPNPDFKLGVTNTFKYKHLSLSFVLDYKKGGDLYSTTISSLLGRGVTKDTEDRERTHVIPGVLGNADTAEAILDASGNTIPNNIQITTNEAYFGKGGIGSQAYDELKVYDATVFRLREVALSYELPQKYCAKLGLTALRLGLTGRNLFYFAPGVPKHSNFDPEVNTFGSTNNQGMEFGAAPSVRRFGVNVNLTF